MITILQILQDRGNGNTSVSLHLIWLHLYRYDCITADLSRFSFTFMLGYL